MARQRKRERLDVDERRAQLVALGLDRFGARPYDEVSLEELAEAAGISKGLVYHYFPSKKSFYAATVRFAAQRLVDMTRVEADEPSLALLVRALDVYLDYVKAHGPAYAALLRSAGVDPELAAIVDETRATFIERLSTAIPAPNGGDGRPLRLALRGFIGLVEATSLDWIEHGGMTKGALARFLAQALLDLTRAAATA